MKSTEIIEFTDEDVKYRANLHEKQELKKLPKGTFIMVFLTDGAYYNGYFKGLTDDILEKDALLQLESGETIKLNVTVVENFLIHSETIANCN